MLAPRCWRGHEPAQSMRPSPIAPSSTDAPPRPGRPWLRIALQRLPSLLPALVFLPIVLSPPLNHDVAAVLQFSQRWLAGEGLYTVLIDVNPPLIYVLNLLPAWIASVTPLDAVTVLRLCVMALGLACWFLSLRARDRVAEGPAERAFLDVLPALFLLDAGYDFGQREHLMAVAALPYVIAASRRAAGDMPRGRIAIALIAGVGFAIKPYFLGIPGLVELAVLVCVGWRRWLRDPVPWLMAGVWAIYLASFPLAFPAFVDSVLPLIWSYYIDLGGLSVIQVLFVPRLGAVLCLLMPLLWIAFRSGVPMRVPGAALPRLMGLASAVVQHKGWSYHIVPIELFACGLGAVLAARWLDRLRASTFAPGPWKIAGALGGLFALYAISNGEAPWKQLDYPGSEVAELTAQLREHAAGERVLVLSPAIYPVFPALNYAGVKATLRTMNMWPLEGAYGDCLPDGRRYREVWEMSRPEFFVYRTVAEDFARAPPAAVVVDTEPGIPWCGKDFDYVEYFARHPLFAEVWSRYRLTAEWDHFRLYTRKD